MMIEKHFILVGVEPLIFYGAQNANLRMLKSLYPKLRLMARGNMMRAVGEEEVLQDFEQKLNKLIAHCVKYNRLTPEDLLDIVHGGKTEVESSESVILYSTGGKAICPRNEHQEQLVKAFGSHDLIFATGPAGTGKTYLSIALAVSALKRKSVRKIILSRPAVEAGEKLGFLPGDMKEKIDPYLQPLYDALEEMIPPTRLQELLEQNIIQIAPLAFMRGRTLNDAVVILDEAQNTTPSQLKMFLTRMGMGTKMIVTGDITQVDLPHTQRSGLVHSLRILSHIPGISHITFDKGDIVRHKLVTLIVDAYDHDTSSASRDDDASSQA